MILFLTSSPTGPLDNSRIVDGFDDKNRFVENLRRYWREESRCLMIAADPHDMEFNDILCEEMGIILKRRGFSFSSLEIWDERTTDFSPSRVRSFDFILLCGGHVPTQNAFFQSLSLRTLLREYTGVIIGVSAGSMNCTDVVYAQPELPGESVDPDYRRFIPGLNLSRIQILPHYQMVRDNMLDGKRLFEDITFSDSFGREFIVLIDGSYVMRKDDTYTLWGEGYRIRDGVMTKICEKGGHIVL